MMRRLLLLWTLIYSILVPAQHFHDTQGKLEISNAGQATYTLPIAMPPSLKNTGPVINIVYQSGLLGGIAGQGWNISSISAITRIASRTDLDGSREGVHFDSTDKLALNGQRLLVVSGEYWQIGSVYQTETQSNLKIELQRSGFGLYFIVTAPDGSRSWYGNYDNNSTDLSAFYIRRYEDPLGNYITYRYTKPFAKSLCISEIRFSGNTHGLAPLNSIQFHYKKAQRTESAYARGQKLEKIALLSHIEVKTNNQLFRKYEFTHITDPQLGYEKVSQIQEFNGAMEPANPVIFEYENTQTQNIGSEILTSYQNNLDFSAITLSGDFDGDGRLDFITNNNKIYTKLFEGNSSTPITFSYPNLSSGKFTATTLHNGKLNPFQSIVSLLSDLESVTFHISNFNGASRSLETAYQKAIALPNFGYCTSSCPSSPCHNQTYIKDSNKYLEGDFNGDGISEVLIIGYEESTKYNFTPGNPMPFPHWEGPCKKVIQKNPTPNLARILDLNPNSSTTLGTKGYIEFTNSRLFEGVGIHTMDFNSDGKTDVLIIKNDKTYKVINFKELTQAPWLEIEILGEGTLDSYSPSKQILFGDFNGDGKTDVMLPRASGKYNETNDWWDIYYSNPKPDHTSFFTMETFRIVDYWQHSGMHFKDGIQYSSYYVLDTNGDGKSDLVRIWRNYYKPKWTINDHDTNWKITSFVNNIGKTGTSGFTLDYETPCQNYDNSCDHHSDSPDMVIPIVSTYRHGINKEILMVRNHYNQVTYVNFTKDVAKDNLLKKVTTADGALVYEIAYQPLDTSDQNDGYGNPDEFYSSSHSVSYPNVEIKRLPFNRVVSRLTHTVGEITRHQDFRYHGYTVNIHGLGTLGFTKTARSSWYQNPSDSKIWNVMHNDPTKRGLLINTYAQLQRSGAAFSLTSGSNIPENVISSMTNQYAITTNNKVYTPLLTRQTTTDYLTSVKTVKDYQYQPVFCLPEIVRTQNFLDTSLQGETTFETEYQSNPSGVGSNYYIGRPIKTIETSSAYNDRHQSETLYTYHSNGTLQKIQKKPVAESYYITTEFEYDDYGNITQETLSAPDASPTVAPRVSEYTYDPSGRFIINSRNMLDHITLYTYHPLYGTVLTKTEPNHITTTSVYDNWGKPLSATDYLDNSTQYTYLKNSDGYTTQITNTDGSSSISVANTLGQQIKKGIKLSDGQWSYIATQYDFLGRKIKESDPFPDTPSLWTTYAYDANGRLIQTTLPTGKITHITYDGLTVTTDDGRKTSSLTKNANGHTISSTDNGGTVTYNYNAGGAVTESDFQGTKITTQYDNWGRKSSLNDPSAGRYEYSYYPFGEVRTTTTPKGSTTHTINRFGVTEETLEENNDGNSYLNWYYYNADHTPQRVIRKNVQNEKIVHKEDYQYDQYRRPHRITQATPHATFIKELTYDAFGRIDKEKQTATVKTNGKNSSKTFRYTYQFGYRHQILDDATGQALWTAHSVNARDQLTQGAFGNGLHIGNQYDDYGYIQRSDTYHPNRNTSAGRPMLNLVTQFDIRTGNLTARKNNLLNHSATFQYDTLDRLVQWDNETVMLHHDTFDQAIGEFEPKTCATLTNENGSLKVAITPNCTGIKKVLLAKAKVGDQLKIRFDFNKGTTHITRISIWEYNPDNGQYFKSPKDYTSNGTQSFEHTVTQYPVIELHLDTLPLAGSYPMVFFLDNLLVTMDRSETQRYDNRGRITENKLGQYNYTDTDKAYRNTSIDLNAEDASYYQNREGIFNDGMEAQKGWSDLGIGWSIFGKPIYDDSKSKTGKYSLKIHNPTDKSHTLHADRWIPIDNPHGASYTFSGWVYSDRPSSRILLFMNSETETGYYTIVADTYTETTSQWVYMERTVYVPSHIKKLNIRVDNQGGGNVWFDDIRIRKTSNPKTDLRQLNVTYDLFKKPITITETGVEKVAFSYTADHFRNTMYYGGLEDPEQQPLRKDYAADGSMEITTNQQTGVSTFVFFVGGDAYTAPAIFKDNGQTRSYYYLHRDYQGTIVAISNQNGNFVEKRLFDPWGKLLKVQDGQDHNLVGLTLLDRGYTGHEHIQGVGIINMNGRIYDPKLHRFLSPDNYVQDPYNTQNYNRYGYCWNNPLKFTDPDGEFVWFVPVIFAAVNVGVDLLIHDGKMNFGQIAMSAGMGAVGGCLGGGGITTVGQAFLAAGINQINRFLPNIPIYQSANFNLGISPMIGFGSSGFTAGGSLNASGKLSDFVWSSSISAGYNSGMSSLGEAAGNSSYFGVGGFAGCNDGHANYGIGLSSTTFSGNTAQRVGAINFQIGDFGIRIDEDYLPHIGDKRDRYRTGGLLATYKINDAFTLAIGGSMMTGEMMKDITIPESHPKTYNYTFEKTHHLRAGTFYGGVINKGQSFFAGHNSEKRLHDIQNWIHGGGLKRTIGIGPVLTPYFYDFKLKSRMYSYFGSYHPSYLYY